MYILKNSFKNLTRNKGRNILIGIIIFAMISVTAVSIIIHTTTNEMINDYKTKFGTEVTIQPDMEKLLANGDGGMIEFPQLTTDELIKYSKSDKLKETLFNGYFSTYTENYKALDQDAENDYTSMGSAVVIDGGSSAQEYKSPNITVVGTSNLDSLSEFKDGLRKVNEGRIFQNANECVVSEDFAKLNNLKVGDTIELENYYSNDTSKKLKLIVTGTYLDLTKSEGMFKSASTNRKNEILTSFDTLVEYNKLFEEGKSSISTSAVYHLKNAELINDFRKELREKDLKEVFSVTTDEAGYNAVVQPLKGIGKMSLILMGIVLAFGSIILVILSVLSIRERKYEIGVLRAMGMEKYKVAKGFIYETLIIISICLVFGLGVGAGAAQPVSNIMLESQKNAVVDINSQNFGGGTISMSVGSSSSTTTQEIEAVEIKLSLDAVIKIIGIALLLGLLSCMVGISYITKYEPIKILTERN
ncbi:MAG: FtsX-like permease family protein [Clostridium sp.]